MKPELFLEFNPGTQVKSANFKDLN